MDGDTRTPGHRGGHRRPDPPGRPLGRVVTTVSVGGLLLLGVGVWSAPVWSWHPVVRALTGPVGDPAPDPFAPVVVQVPAPDPELVPIPEPVVVPPTTVRIHRGAVTQDCTLTDPAAPLYTCPVGGK